MPIPLVAAAPVGIKLAGVALSAMGAAIAALYGVASDLNDFIDRHIDDMKASSNATVEKTGRILEMAKFGFGLGYLSSVTIMAVGQLLLGNTLSAVSTVATAAALSNPIAMTCAAVGAIVYGWHALSDAERTDLLDKLAHGLEIGVQLIQSVVGFVVQTAKDLFDSKLLKDFKAYIADKAGLFGRNLSDVTHLAVDSIADAAAAVKKRAQEAANATAKAAGEASDKVGEAFTDLGRGVDRVKADAELATQQVLLGGKEVIRRVRERDDGPQR
jgi:hypothetical protein